jgi:hypothetical protein
MTAVHLVGASRQPSSAGDARFDAARLGGHAQSQPWRRKSSPKTIPTATISPTAAR